MENQFHKLIKATHYQRIQINQQLEWSRLNWENKKFRSKDERAQMRQHFLEVELELERILKKMAVKYDGLHLQPVSLRDNTTLN